MISFIDKFIHHSFQQKMMILGSWSTILFCFSVTTLGTALTTILSVITIAFWFFSRQYTQFPRTISQTPFTLIALILFIYLGLSLLWSNDLDQGMSIWKKYREFIFFPVYLSYFSNNKLRKHGLLALYLGMTTSLIISYLVYFNLLTKIPRIHSIGNHIFHGILLSFYAYWTLTLSTNQQLKKFRPLFVILFLASFFTLFFIREGRTGYILFSVLSYLFVYQQWKKPVSLLTLLLIIIFSTYLSVSTANSSFLSRYLNPEFLDLDFLAQYDIRFEYYINTFRIIIDNWLLGVGVGDFPAVYQLMSSAHQHFWPPTVNCHNEFMMIMVMSGIFGLFLFTLFFIYLAKTANKLPLPQSRQAFAVIITIVISCLFNSSFKDSQDGTLFLLLICLFFSQPLSDKNVSDQSNH